MKRPLFLLISAIPAFVFGTLMFLAPALAAQSLGIELTVVSASLLHGMGGLIIGHGAINFFFATRQIPAHLKPLS